MTLMLDFGADISDCCRPGGQPGFRLKQWDLHQNPGTLAFRAEMNCPIEHGGSFPDTLNPHPVRRDYGDGVRIKSATVVGHSQLQAHAGTSKYNVDCIRSRMFRHIG